MTLSPSWIDPLAEGNNANARTVGLRVMNGETPTAWQLSATDNLFARYQQEFGLSLSGFTAVDRVLADGSHVRISSNGGQHSIQLWPAPTGPSTPLQPLFFAVPSSLDAYYPDGTKASQAWRFRGATDAPAKLNARRVLNDEPDIRQHPGNLTWWSDALLFHGKPIIVSWYGRASRYGRSDYYGRNGQECLFTATFKELFSPTDSSYVTNRTQWDQAYHPWVWTNGVRHKVHQTVAGSPVDVPIISAALKKDTDGATWLYLVSHASGHLAVFSGKVGDIYRPGNWEVSHLFDIDFTIASTPYSTDDPFWETILQPLYFNASCTDCAGLVVVAAGSTLNADAAAVAAVSPGWGGGNFGLLLTTVDLVAQTTTFSCSDSKVITENTGSQSTDPVTSSVLLANTPMTRNAVYKTTYIRYEAVDYVGDTLAVAMSKIWQTQEVTESGAASYDAPHHDGTMTVKSGWQLLRLADSAVLADRAEVTAGTSSVTMSGTLVGALSGTSTGTRTESMALPVFVRVGVEGGDLRHNALVAYEFMEIGPGGYNDTLSATGGTGAPWDNNAGGYNWNQMSFYSGAGAGRYDAARFSVWKDAVELATSLTVQLGFARASRWGYIYGAIYAFAPQSNSGSPTVQSWFEWVWQPPIVTGTSVGAETLPSFSAGYAHLGQSPYVQSGAPHVNSSAFVPDGSQFFYAVGSFWNSSSAPPAADTTPVGAFVIDGTSYPLDGTKYSDVGVYNPVLSSPIYIDNVPIQEPLT